MAFDATLTLVGGPTVLIELAGLRFLTDPTFDAPGLYQVRLTLDKLTGPALAVEQVGSVDAVLLSHDQHFDNLDHGGRAFLTSVRTTFTTPVGAGRLGGNAVGLEPWRSQKFETEKGAVHVTAAP